MIDIKLSKVDKIEYIIHIGDIHIRQLDRHDEYLHVFDKLYEEVEDKIAKNKNTVVYIAGDIVHNKLDITSEMVTVVQSFIKNLCKLTDTFVFVGNHDLNVKNTDRVDILTATHTILELDSFHLLKYTDVYKANNVSFSVMSVFDTKDKFYLIDDFENNDINIALYHGIINGSATNNFEFKNEGLSLSTFKGFDFVMLGDVHKYQKLTDNPPTVYCGSMLQQNYGESVENHGYVLWDVANKSHTFHELENEYGYFTIHVNDVDDIKYNNITAKHPNIRLNHEGLSENEILDVKSKLRDSFDVKSFENNNLNKKLISEAKRDINTTGENLSKIEEQNKLIKEYLLKYYTHEYNADTLNDIFDINKELNENLDTSKIQKRNVNWKLVSFEFSNMFTYKEGNYIDFTKISDLTGLFAPNKSGKSKLIDAISYCLFDKSSSTNDAIDVLNSSSNSFQAILKFIMNNVTYIIKKSGKRQKSGVKVVLDFSYEDADTGELKSLNGQTKPDTVQIMKSYFGTYENFEITSLYSQSDKYNFIKLSQKDKKELLSDFLNIDIFKHLYDSSKIKLDVYKEILSKHSNHDYDAELTEVNTLIKEYKNNIETTKKQYYEKMDHKKTLVSKKEELHNKLKTETDVRDLTLINNDIAAYKQKVNNLETQLSDLLSKKENLRSKFTEASTNLEKFDIEQIKEYHSEYKNVLNEYNQVKNDYNIKSTELTNKKDATKKLQQLEYDENCSYCMNNIFVKDAIQIKDSINSFELKVNELKLKLKKLEDKTKLYEKSEHQWTEYNEVLSNFNDVKNQAYSLKNKIAELEINKKEYNRKLEILNEELVDYNTQKETIVYNKKIKEEISEVKLELNKVENELEDINANISSYNSDLKYNNLRISTINDNIEDYKKSEKKYKSFVLYNKVVHRNALPLFIIKENFELIEDVCNNILSDFGISLKFELDKSKIKSYVKYEGKTEWSLNLISGMETFVISIAIRIALIKISNISKPDFFVIDEGFGSLDTNSFELLKNIISTIKNEFSYIIIISHLDKVKDLVDNIIDIEVTPNGSLIQV